MNTNNTMITKDPKRVEAGKKARINGKAFELIVRKDMTEKGWTVDKFGNNVDLDDEILIQAKSKWAGPRKPMMIGAGFPDFVCFKLIKSETDILNYDVIGIECKCNGYLDKVEKEKCRWLLDNKIFNKIYIAKKTNPENRVVIVYHDFKEKYNLNKQEDK